MNYPSFRQSPQWEHFMRFLKWEAVKLPSGDNAFFLKSPLGTVCKIQRPNQLSQANLENLDKIAMQKKALFIKLEPNLTQDISLLAQNGYIPTEFPLAPPKTMLLDLTKTQAELWGAVSHSGKYSINRARRENSMVEIIKNPTTEQIERFYRVQLYTGKRGKFYVEPLAHALAVAKEFADHCYLAWVFDNDNKLESAKIFVDYKNVLTYIRGGTTPAGRKQKGGYLLMWEAMLYFKNLGFELIDLEGLDDKRFYRFTRGWGGFSHFKEKFGGIVVEFPAPHLKIYNPVLKFISKIMPIPF